MRSGFFPNGKLHESEQVGPTDLFHAEASGNGSPKSSYGQGEGRSSALWFSDLVHPQLLAKPGCISPTGCHFFKGPPQKKNAGGPFGLLSRIQKRVPRVSMTL